MTSYLFNRGQTIFWRRRMPGRAAKIFGRSHLILSLRTRDPKRARQLSRRLAVHFDEIFGAMDQITTTLTKEQQEAILQSFRDLIIERLELRKLLIWAPTDAQRTEMLRNAPTSLDALNAIFADEEAYLDSNPAAKAAHEERRAAQTVIAQFGDPEELRATWTDALQRNDTSVVTPLLEIVLQTKGVAAPSNSLGMLKLRRQALESGIAILDEVAYGTPTDGGRDAPSVIRLKPSPKLSELIEAFIAEKNRNTEERKGYTANVEGTSRMTLRLWRETFGDRPVRSYTKQEAGEFRDLLLRLPREHGKSSKLHATLRERIAWADADPRPLPRLKMKTAKRHFTPLRQYWKYLLARGHVDIDIFDGFTFPGTSSAKRRRNQWTPEALETLFSLLGGRPRSIAKQFAGGDH